MAKFANVSYASFNLSNTSAQTFGGYPTDNFIIINTAPSNFIAEADSTITNQSVIALNKTFNLGEVINVSFTVIMQTVTSGYVNVSVDLVGNTNNTLQTIYYNNISTSGAPGAITNIYYEVNVTGAQYLYFNVSGLPGGVFDVGIQITSTLGAGFPPGTYGALISAMPENVTAYITNSSSIFFNQPSFLNISNATSNFYNDLNTVLNTCTADTYGNCNLTLFIKSNDNSTILLNNLNITYVTTAGLYTRARDVDTLGLLNGTTLVISNGTNQVTSELNFSGNDTIFFPYINVPTGSVTLTYSNTGYTPVVYYTSINYTAQSNVTAYLQNTSKPTAIFVTFITQTSGGGAPIANALISVYSPINGTYTLIGQRTSDGAGSASFTLDSTITYLITVTATGYNTVNQTLNPTLNSYYINLAATTTTPFVFPYSNLFIQLNPYYLTPNNATGLQAFSFYVKAKDNSIAGQGIFLTYVNGTILNSSTTNAYPNGTTLNLTWNMSNWNRTLILIGNFTRTNGYVGQDVRIYLNDTFFMYSGNSTLSSALAELNDTTTGPGWLLKGIFAFILVGLFAATMLKYTNSPVAVSLVSYVFLTILTVFGFIAWGVWLILLAGTIGLLYFVYKG